MVRIAKLLLLLLFVTHLNASDTKKLIDEADRLLRSNNNVQIAKAYDNYKSAYINALLDGDSALAERAKEGVEKSSSLLETPPKTNSSPPRIDNPDIPKVMAYRANKNQIFITLSKPLDLKEVNTFSLEKKKVNKVIFDFPGTFHKQPTHIRSAFFKDVRIAQFSPDTVRVVLEKGLNFEAEAAIIADKLILSAFSTHGKRSKRTAPVALPKSKTPVITNIPKSQKRGKTIFIDPGHGGRDGGAVGYRETKEKDVVLDIGRELSKELKKRGYRVKMSRDRDIFIPLRDRTHMANQNEADLFVSVHANSVGRKINVKGIETYFLSPARSERAKKVASAENSADLKEMSDLSQETFLSFLNREKVTASNKFAIDLQKNILANLKKNYGTIKDNGVREGPFWVLVGAQMPAVLVEVGYITNPTEAKRMKTRKYQKLIAKGIADGIDNFFYYN